jgi:vancomycin resistance protein YoaR
VLNYDEPPAAGETTPDPHWGRGVDPGKGVRRLVPRSGDVADDKRDDVRFGLIFVSVLALLFGSLYVIGAYMTRDTIPHGTAVGNVKIGGLSRDAAEARLNQSLAGLFEQPIMVRAGNRRIRLNARAAGIGLDVPATVGEAFGGGPLSPQRLIRAVIGGDKVPPVLDVDDQQMSRTVKKLADQVDRPPASATITFDGGVPKPVLPSAGTVLDRQRAASVIEQAFLTTSDPVDLPMTTVEPPISRAAVVTALNEFANPAVADPVRLQVGGHSVEVSPKQFGPALSMRTVDGAIHPQVDSGLLWRRLGRAVDAVLPKPHNAHFVVRNGRPHLLAAKAGRTVRRGVLAGRLLSVLPESGSGRTVVIPTVPRFAWLTTVDAKALHVSRQISSYDLSWHGKVTPWVRQAVRRVGGTVVRPGQTFSFNGKVGRRHIDLSPLATAVFNAAFKAGLQDTHHAPHPIARAGLPAGREVAVGWPDIDFSFTDDTPFGVLIQATLQPANRRQAATVHVRLYSSPYFQTRITTSNHYRHRPYITRYDPSRSCTPRAGIDGFDIDVRRSVLRHGNTVTHRRYHVAYLPRDHVICRKPPSAHATRGNR